MSEIREKQYPQNLLMDIFNTENFELCIETNNVNDFIHGLEHVLLNLTNNEFEIISLIYKHGKSYKEIAKEMQITVGRVRTIEKDSLRKLRRKDNINYIKYGFRLCNLIKSIEVRITPQNACIRDIDIGVSNRYRIEQSGIFFLKDIKSKKQLMGIKGIGEKTTTKIIEKAKEYGIEIN